MLNAETVPDPSDVAGGYLFRVSSKRPMELIEFVDLVNNLRQTHAGIITLARGSVREGALKEQAVDETGMGKNAASAGWHIHGKYYALNLSKGSEIPTLFTRPADASRAIVASIDAHRQALSEVGRTKPFPFGVLDLQERDTPIPPRTLLEHVQDVRETLVAVDGGLERSSQAWNLLRSLAFGFDAEKYLHVKPIQDVLLRILRESQSRIPRDRILEISPRDHDAYAIPPLRPHARSIREGKVYRPDGTNNVFVALDKETGRMVNPNV